MPYSFQKYRTFQVEDFVTDQDFQQWVHHPDQRADLFWLQFLQMHPNKRDVVEEAREIISNIRYTPYILPPEKQDHILRQVYRRTETPISPGKQVSIGKLNRKHLAVAATITLALVSTLIIWLTSSSYTTYETGYQENRTILLSDGSEVTLNANTKMEVKIDTRVNAPREVWLEGEAYFQVKQLSAQAVNDRPALKTFIVHTDNFDIEVLGTTFNVASHSRKSEVLLKSGKVMVASHQIEQTQILQPGDLLTLSRADQNFQLKKTEPDQKLAWRDNLFVFENTPLHLVARTLENYYGIEVEIDGQQLANKTFTAKISRDELPMLLKALEASFEVTITEDSDLIRIQPR